MESKLSHFRNHLDRRACSNSPFLQPKTSKREKTRVIVLRPLDDVLKQYGYKLIDDCWLADGRRTYIHNDSADRPFHSN